MDKGYTVEVLDHGYLTYLDSLGNDQYLADTARVSTGSIGKGLGLVTRLVADRHTSPIEFGIVQFEIKAPLFVFREWHRHRTQSYSEMSARFGELPMDFYLPSLERMNPQHTTNKQMSDETKQVSNPETERGHFVKCLEWCVAEVNNFRSYTSLARELAQRLYPQNRYTVCRASGNLWNWMAFLKLRMANDAQYEIRQYANEVEKILKELFPVAMEAFEEYILYAQTFSKSEIKMLSDIIKYFNLDQNIDATFKDYDESSKKLWKNVLNKLQLQ